jgi:hypothetical protein
MSCVLSAPGPSTTQRESREIGLAGMFSAFSAFQRWQCAVRVHLPCEPLVSGLTRRRGAGGSVRGVRPRGVRSEPCTKASLRRCQIFPHDHHDATPGVTGSRQQLGDVVLPHVRPDNGADGHRTASTLSDLHAVAEAELAMRRLLFP